MRYSKAITTLLATVMCLSTSLPVCAKQLALPKDVATDEASLESREELEKLLPAVSETPVYDLYNGSTHLYTTDYGTKNKLVEDGWEYQGVAFYSADSAQSNVPVYCYHDEKLNYVYSTNADLGGYTKDGVAFYANAAATAYRTIELNSDLTSTYVVRAGEYIRLNLNGHNIKTSSGPAILVQAGGHLIVEGNGHVYTSSKDAAVRNNGNMVIKGGSYENNNNYCVINHGNMLIEGGDFYHTALDCGSSLINTGYYNYYSGNAQTGHVAGQNASSPMLVIEGGSFHKARYIVKNDDNARTVIEDGEFYHSQYSVVKNWSKIDIVGGTYSNVVDPSYGLLTNGYLENHKDYTLPIDAGMMNIYGGMFADSQYLFYPGNNNGTNALQYGSIHIYDMDVAEVDALANGIFPYTENKAHNMIKGISEIQWA